MNRGADLSGATATQRVLARSFAVPIFRQERQPRGLRGVWQRLRVRMVFGWSMRAALYRHLAAQNRNGRPLEEALDGFLPRLRRRRQTLAIHMIENVGRSMRDGATLAEALAPWVPPEEASVIECGEMAGKVPAVLDQLLESTALLQRVQRAFKAALVAPAVYAVVLFGFFWFIGFYVLPGITPMLPRERATGSVTLLYVIGDLATSAWSLLIPVLAVGVGVLVNRSMTRWTGPWRLLAERWFPFSFYRDINGFRWLVTFVDLFGAGVPDVEILRRQLQSASPWLAERLRAYYVRMQNGASLSAALLGDTRRRQIAFEFPHPDVIDDLASLDGFGDFSVRVPVLVKQWTDELEHRTKTLATRIGVAIEFVMYAVMGLLMIAINSLSSQLSTLSGV